MQSIKRFIASNTLFSFLVAAGAAAVGVPMPLCIAFVGTFGVKEGARHFNLKQ